MLDGSAPLDVQFTNQSNVYATTFIWEFDDGGSSELENPLHQFVNFGSSNTTISSTGIIYLYCLDLSTVDIMNSDILGIYAHDSSHVNISNSILGFILSYESCRVNVLDINMSRHPIPEVLTTFHIPKG